MEIRGIPVLINNIMKIQNNSYISGLTINKQISFARRKNTDKDIFISSRRNTQITPAPESANDRKYRKQLCRDMGIKGITPDMLQSVMAPDEYRSFIAENSGNRNLFVTGERPKGKEGIIDSNGIEYVKMKIFGSALHIHTVHSDGKLSIQEVLNQASEYADEYAKVNHKPFVIGITDHNTLEGCKEAVKLIAQNPRKYSNLKVVLGTEISTKEDEINGYKLRKPEKYHILVTGINPFDKKSNQFLDYLQSESGTPMHIKSISVQEAFDGLKHQSQCFFSLAHPAYPDIKHRIYSDKNPYEAEAELIEHFKNVVQNRALYAECYYSSYYGSLATDEQLHKTIDKTCDNLGLYKAGGIDTHGESIFYNGEIIFRDKKSN